MPIINQPGASGGGGPAAGTYLPVADATGVTVDTTTYANPIEGADKLTTLVFPLDTVSLALAVSGDAFPRMLYTVDGGDGIYWGDGTFDPTSGGNIYLSGTAFTLGAPSGGSIALSQHANVAAATAATDVPRISQVSPKFTVTSGALSNTTLTTGVGKQISTSRDVETHTAVIFTPTAIAAATCQIELSPDNVTYTDLGVGGNPVTVPIGTVLDGFTLDVSVRVPAGWYLRLTVTNAALSPSIFY